MNKIKNIIYGICLSSLLAVSCEDEHMAVDPDIYFSADKTTVNVGDTVTFEMSTNLQSLVLFTGDTLRNYDYSRDYVVATSDKDPSIETLLLPDPSLIEFREELVGITEKPASITVGGSLTDDNFFLDTEGLGLQVGINGEGWGNDLLIQPNVPINPMDRILSFKWKYKSAPEEGKAVRLAVTIKIDGVYTDWSLGQGRLHLDRTMYNTFFESEIDLGPLIDIWKSENPDRTYGPLEEVKIVLGGGPATARYTGDLIIENLSFGQDGFIPFSTGEYIPFVYSDEKVTFKHVYEKAGTFEAVLLSTRTDRKTHAGYEESRGEHLTAKEYLLDKYSKFLTINVLDTDTE